MFPNIRPRVHRESRTDINFLFFKYVSKTIQHLTVKSIILSESLTMLLKKSAKKREMLWTCDIDFYIFSYAKWFLLYFGMTWGLCLNLPHIVTHTDLVFSDSSALMFSYHTLTAHFSPWHHDHHHIICQVTKKRQKKCCMISTQVKWTFINLAEFFVHIQQKGGQFCVLNRVKTMTESK